MSSERGKIWVLWHRYSDGSGAHVERAYFSEERARDDLQLLTEGEGERAHGWWLVQVPLIA